MKNIMKTLSDIYQNMLFGIKHCYRASRKYFIIKCLILLSTTVMPLLAIWIWKEILNEAVSQHISEKRIPVLLSAYLFLKLSVYLCAKINLYTNSRYSDELKFYIGDIMIEKISYMKLSFYDSAMIHDKVEHTKRSFRAMNETTWLVFDVISKLINIAATLIIVCTYKWWIGLLTVIVLIPYMIYNKKYMDKRLRMNKEQRRENRKKDYFRDAFFDSDIQFEIKLNDIGGYFIDNYTDIWNTLYKINKKEDVRNGIISTAFQVMNISSEVMVLITSAVDVLAKRIHIGDLTYNLSMVTRLREQTSALITDINRMLANNTLLCDLREFIAIESEAEDSGTKLPSADPRIEFRNVSFRYPGCEQYVLKNCSFTIEPHEKVGLIGLNGAGKSTIIKLILRFYDPEEGNVLLDGVDLKEYNVYAVRKVFGVLFQDYVTYCLPLREIIALSDFDERFNEEKLKRASGISGLTEVIKDWENGFDSVLGRYYADNGKDLSGGQWQLVGLTRAYFKESEYMILDEPSAALDPISEDRVFEQLYHLSDGKSSVTISHRLSNTTLADKILVIGDGHVIEQGSHSELLKQNGLYAHLFRLQAERYK